jgi:hypothetical protein
MRPPAARAQRRRTNRIDFWAVRLIHRSVGEMIINLLNYFGDLDINALRHLRDQEVTE